MDVFEKGPQAILDYKFDWMPLTHHVAGATTDYLQAGETIITATVTAPAGLTVVSSSITDAGTSVTAWLSGGLENVDYECVCHITTSIAPRADDRTIIIRVIQR